MNEKLTPQRAKQRIAHTIDNIAGRDLPHLQIHLEDALKSKTLKSVREHLERAKGHADEASKQSRLLSGAIQSDKGVVQEAKRLARAQDLSDGLLSAVRVKFIPPPKPTVANGKGSGLSKFANKVKLGAKVMSKGA